MSSVHPSDGKSPLPTSQYNREQAGEILKGLDPGHRLAFDSQTGKFVSLKNKSGDSAYIQDLSDLANKIIEFVDKTRGIGVSSEDIWRMHRATEKRSRALKGRMSGLRGLFLSQKAKDRLNLQSSNLSNIAKKIDSWMVNYLDEYGLLSGARGEAPIAPHYREWYLNQAVLLEQMEHVDPETREQLGLILLHGYSKAAPRKEENIEEYGLQSSPVLQESFQYHRGLYNKLLQKTNTAFAKDMGVPPSDLLLVDSPLFREVLSREAEKKDIETEQQFGEAIDQVLENLALGVKPKKLIFIEITKLLTEQKISPTDIDTHVIPKLKEILQKRQSAFKKKHPKVKARDINDVLQRIQLIAFTQHKEKHVLLTPKLEKIEKDVNNRVIEGMMTRTGFCLGIDAAKAAWLKVSDPLEILEQLGLPKTKLATKGEKIPQVCDSYSSFLKQPIVSKFYDLSSEEAPYLQILPQATVHLLEGLNDFQVDKTYKNKALNDLLQISYYRMFNAMNEAILQKGDLNAFNNQIELIHQEIQSILTIVQPYDDDEFSRTMKTNLTTGDPPLISSELPEPRAYIKASGMHCTTSALAGIEAQKGTNKLNVAVLKDSYYEASNLLTESDYTMTTLDGDKFADGGIQRAFDKKPTNPLDALVCEFHHNISIDRQEYRPEKVAEQVKSLFKEKMVAEQFTVLIDTTINLENAEDVRAFLADPEITQLVDAGKLNIVLLRSAQKFDMLGMDNYYGGIAVSLNNPEVFSSFNKRMDSEDDRVRGLSYQGLTHLEKYGRASIEAYRKGIMENTQKLYKLLPQSAIYSKNSSNPIQISKMDDDKLVFLDLAFPEYPESGQAIIKKLIAYARKNQLFFSQRPSFGFSTTNIVSIKREMFRLTPGLEDEESVRKLAQFFIQVQDVIENALHGKEFLPQTIRDLAIARAIKRMKL